ncbi:MAG: DUF255 domain-containing protein [Candidatus Freyarchaeum deiterrae]
MAVSQKVRVNWRDWNEEAFKVAEREGKLILLNLSATWCYWCRVMDETSYSDPEIIDIINSKFIPVLVNIDRRPDIAERYNFGGSPTTAFLTPEGEVVTGGTYIPTEKLKPMLGQVREFYETNKASIKGKISELQKTRARAETTAVETGELSESIVQDIVDRVVDGFDSMYGGFGTKPKLPMSEAIELVLSQYQLKKDDVLLYIATKTLDEMRRRNICDRIAGGFFRYSMAQDWSSPHYEKILQSNAQLLRNYIHAYQVTGKAEYTETSRSIIGYVSSTLSDKENGGFYGSQAADEQYYKLPKDERVNASSPQVDKTIYTDWNALMVSAYLEAYAILGIEECRKFAVKTLEFIADKLYQKGVGMYHYFDGEPKVAMLLNDNLFFSRTLIDAYQILGEKTHLEQAEEIADFILDNFVDMQRGGVFDSLPDVNAIGLLKNRGKVIMQNGLAADMFNTLYHLTDKKMYHSVAEVTLTAFAKTYQSHELYATAYAQAVDRFLNPAVKIVVIGPKSDDKTHELHTKALNIFEPRRIVELLDPEEDKEKIQKSNFPEIAEPAVYACIENSCSPPIKEPDNVLLKLKQFISR